MRRAYPALFLISGALITYSIGMETNPVFAASLVGLIFGLLFPSYSAPAYCGAFIGMSSVEILPSGLLVLLASLVSGFVWVHFSKQIPAFGGKAGFIAFLGVLAINLPMIWEVEPSLPLELEVEMILGVIVTAVIATSATFLVREKIRERFKSDAVIGSALVGFPLGFLRLFFPGVSIYSEVAFASSFAGMTSFKFVRKPLYYLLIGLVVGVVFLLSTPFFRGFGGKLGTIAFLSVMLFLSLKSLH